MGDEFNPASRLRPPSRSALEHGVNKVYRWVGVAVGLSLVLLVIVLWWQRDREESVPMPDFASIENTDEKKATFFNFLRPFIEKANAELLADREILLDLSGQSRLSSRDEAWLRETAQRFGFEIAEGDPLPESLVKDLLVRVDKIPASLALAQAALESGWGTSRFARQGNNLFGIWCYEPGCGIVPKRRPPGRTYEVKRYATPENSFLDYMENLNSNSAYRELWRIRASLRSDGQPIRGTALAAGLTRYSQEGWEYVEKVRSMIRSNGLE